MAGKTLTAATTTINDDSDVTTVSFVSGCVRSPKVRTSPTRRHFDEIPCGRRGDGDACQWCNDHYR
ncbi:hypothetical protein OK016_19265 [Vibrio chagasii]|nr:hypothetical protein [Vibrio chagasii]